MCRLCERRYRMDLSIRQWELPRPDEECDLDYAMGAPVEKDVNYALTQFTGIWWT